jgi:serine/threonine protein kinase
MADKDLGFGSQADVTLHEIDGVKCAMKTFIDETDYLRERDVLFQLQHIPGVIELIGWNDKEKRLYLELGYSDCYEYVRWRKEALTIDEVAEFMTQILTIAIKVNAAGIVHRDINTTNIIVILNSENRPQFRLCDFGFAVPIKTECEVVGTENFIPPELESKNVAIAEEKHDAYSVARMWYWFLENVKEGEDATDHKNKIKELIRHRNMEQSLNDLLK